MDTVYFNCKCAPGALDWLRCDVQSKRDGVLRVSVKIGYTTQYMEFPLHNVLRIEYSTATR